MRNLQCCWALDELAGSMQLVVQKLEHASYQEPEEFIYMKLDNKLEIKYQAS